MTNGRGLQAVFGALCVALLAAPMSVQAAPRSLEGQRIVLYTSGGTQLEITRELVLKPFEAETGATVIVDDSCCQRLQAAMQAGEFIGDLLIGVDRAALLARDRSGYFIHDPRLEALAHDLGSPEPLPSPAMVILNTYSYIMAAKDSSVPMPQSWRDFWDTQKFPGPRGVNRTVPQAQFEAALLADGVAPKQLYPLDVGRALKQFDALRDATRLTLNGTGADQINNLGTGETTYAIVYSNRAYLAKRDGIKIAFTFSDGLFEGNGGALLKGAKNIDGAIALLKYHMRPDVLARFAERTGMAPAYPAASAMIGAEYRGTMATAPENMKTQHLLDDTYWQQSLSAVTNEWIGWLAK
jgi:putative spermidine/putrescine transport system substrate-binding protein